MNPGDDDIEMVRRYWVPPREVGKVRCLKMRGAAVAYVSHVA